jgi:RNA polymerase sigma-70 factor (family 1)
LLNLTAGYQKLTADKQPYFPNDSSDEKELFLNISEGDEKAFAELFRIYVPRLENFVLSITKNEMLVDEVIQESFVRIWLNRERLATVDYPKTWIYRIVSYVCFYYLRKQALKQRIIDQVAEEGEQHNPTEELLGLKDLENIIQRAIDRLTPSQQKIYRLSREKGLKIPEIASQLGITSSTVKNTLVTSLRSIREYAASQGFTLSVLILWMSK